MGKPVQAAVDLLAADDLGLDPRCEIVHPGEPSRAALSGGRYDILLQTREFVDDVKNIAQLVRQTRAHRTE